MALSVEACNTYVYLNIQRLSERNPSVFTITRQIFVKCSQKLKFILGFFSNINVLVVVCQKLAH